MENVRNDVLNNINSVSPKINLKQSINILKHVECVILTTGNRSSIQCDSQTLNIVRNVVFYITYLLDVYGNCASLFSSPK